MSPRNKAGSFTFDRLFPGVGRIQAKAWTLRPRVFERRDRLLTTLYEDGQLDTLRAIKRGPDRGGVTIVQVEEARKKKRLLDLSGEARAPLLPTVLRTLSQQAGRPVTLEARCSHVTVNTYRRSWKALVASLPEVRGWTVSDLASCDFVALEANWGRSAAHWNHLRRAISRMLTLHLGRESALRRDILARIPKRTEIPREPDVSPELFWRLMGRINPHLRAPYLLIVATGLRRSEAKQLDKSDLMPETCGVRVRKRVKNEASPRNVYVDPELWPWVEAAVPIAFSMDYLLEVLRQACRQEGVPTVTLHDLRHCFGQWAVDAGSKEDEVQKQLGHKTRHQTAIYTARKLRRDAAVTVGQVIRGVPALVPTRQKRRKGKERVS